MIALWRIRQESLIVNRYRSLSDIVQSQDDTDEHSFTTHGRRPALTHPGRANPQGQNPRGRLALRRFDPDGKRTVRGIRRGAGNRAAGIAKSGGRWLSAARTGARHLRDLWAGERAANGTPPAPGFRRPLRARFIGIHHFHGLSAGGNRRGLYNLFQPRQQQPEPAGPDAGTAGAGGCQRDRPLPGRSRKSSLRWIGWCVAMFRWC